MEVRGMRLLAAFLCVLFVGSVYGQPGSEKAGVSGKPAAGAPEPLTLPIVSKPTTLTHWVAMDAWKVAPVRKRYEDVGCYQVFEKKTGIHIQFVHPPIGQETEQFNLMLASGDLPDMILYNWINFPGGPQKAIDDKLILALNEPFQKYSPNVVKTVLSEPVIRKAMLTDEGNYYVYPYIKYNQNVKAGWVYLVRADWLKKAGIKELPETIDDWYAMLTAFKKLGDINGNGKADEWPLLRCRDRDIMKWLANAWGTDYSFYVVDGKVKFGPLEPEFKDYIGTLRKWFAEGLIDPEFASMDLKLYEAKITNSQAGAFLSGLDFQRYLISLKDFEAITATKYPVVKRGTTPFYNNGDYIGFQGGGTAISAKSKNVKDAAKWLDYHFTEEGGRILNFGVEGQSYVMQDGKPKLTDEIIKNPDGLSVELALGKYAMGGSWEAFFQSSTVREARFWLYPTQKESSMRANQIDINRRLPLVTPTSAESGQVASIMNEVNTYMQESWVKLILGQMSIDRDYGKFVDTIKSMGIDRAIQIQQAALDRYNKR
jgi:putative aldouronate transport system substrate-binding protein